MDFNCENIYMFLSISYTKMNAPRIKYIDSHYQEVDPQRFLRPLSTGGLPVAALSQFIEHMDYSGGIVLDEAEYASGMNRCSRGTQDCLEQLVIHKDGFVHLRGRRYYLDVANEYDQERVRKAVCEHVNFLQVQTGEIPRDSEQMSLPEKALIASLLDHQKHYAMILTFGIFNAMLQDTSIRKEDFIQVVGFCERAIQQFYAFVLQQRSPRIEKVEEGILDLFMRISLPKDRIDSDLEKGARKLVHRDFDHPGQILYYCGSLLENDRFGSSIDVIINPLFGSIELGYGIKAVCTTLGVDKVREVQFIRYSRYGESHPRDLTTEELSKFVPSCLIPELEGLLTNTTHRIVIMDDGIFTGTTLCSLRDFIRTRYDREVELAAVEINPGKSYLKQDNLIVPAIAVRSIIPIRKIINDKLS
jgi:hypothetical protein